MFVCMCLGGWYCTLREVLTEARAVRCPIGVTGVCVFAAGPEYWEQCSDPLEEGSAEPSLQSLSMTCKYRKCILYAFIYCSNLNYTLYLKIDQNLLSAYFNFPYQSDEHLNFPHKQ